MDGLHYHPDDEGDGDGESSELKQAAEEAFPDEEWTLERLASLKALIQLCMGEYGSGDEHEPDSDDGPGKHGPILSLLFGGKPKK